ncbi:hypothetical protein Tco_0801344 [Tanacetum coccineum]|uniref:Uncharacterized protein n=1 Tax=Tanacetum coccineum TaxID=301880 RepID=A0ABQ4ZY08_9ASTR
MKVEAAMAQIEVVGASEKEALKRSKATQKEIDELKDSTESEAEIASTVGTLSKEPIIVQGVIFISLMDCNYYEEQYANDFDGVGYPQRNQFGDNSNRAERDQKPKWYHASRPKPSFLTGRAKTGISDEP